MKSLKEIVSGTMLMLLLIGMLTLAFSVEPVKAFETIYIRADGSVDPPTAPILNVGNISYAFTANINDSIVIERDNIVVDGASYTLPGDGKSNGFLLSGRTNVTIVPDDYPTIQEAINAANPEDTIFVRAGTYYENVVVNKSIRLIGESRDTTIIDGCGNGTVVNIEKSDVHVSGFTIRNAGCVSGFRYPGIRLIGVANCTIEGVSVTNCAVGIIPSNSSCVSIYNSSILRNHFGIVISVSTRIIMRGNNLTCNNVTISEYNGANFRVYGEHLSHFIHDIDGSNKVDGKSICYWVNQHNKEVPSNIGYVAIVNSTNITIEDLSPQGMLLAYVNKSVIRNVNISNLFMGIEMLFSTNNRIVGSTISSSSWGLYLKSLHDNYIINNTVSSNGWGLLLLDSYNNNILNNTFLKNSYGIGLGGENGSSCNLIAGNIISYNFYHGVDMWYSTNNSIVRNNLSHNHNGVLLDRSSWNNVVGNNISHNSDSGVLLAGSCWNNIVGNNINNSKFGVSSKWSPIGNIITENTIKLSTCGVFLGGRRNMVYHNNFIDNKMQAYVPGYPENIWDNGLEGNYWSDYEGSDSDQDGIGDAPYMIYENSRDNCPLMGVFRSFNVASRYSIAIISNYSIFGFDFNQSGTFKFNVDGPAETIGFCRVRIPKALLGDGPYIVTVNGSPPLLLKELAISNTTYEYLYFTYPSEIREVLIIPEFPSSMIILFMVACLIAILSKLRWG